MEQASIFPCAKSGKPGPMTVNLGENEHPLLKHLHPQMRLSQNFQAKIRQAPRTEGDQLCHWKGGLTVIWGFKTVSLCGPHHRSPFQAKDSILYQLMPSLRNEKQGRSVN